jgi:lambda family phage portal protein
METAVVEVPAVASKATSQAKRGGAAMSTHRTSYAAADRGSTNIAFWRPSLKSVDAEVLADSPTIRARARDLVRNNPHAAHAVRISRIAVVGAKLRLALRPDWRFLGLDRKEAMGWAREVERVWDQYSHGPSMWFDAGRRASFTDQFNLVHDEDFIAGEALVTAEWDDMRPWSTCFQVVDIDRLSNPHGAPESDRLKGGVELDRFGAPLAYHIRNAHPVEHGILTNPMANATWSRIVRETEWRRPVVSHSYQLLRAGQTRGLSEFSSAIVALKMGHEYQEMELATATAQASFAAVLTSAANLKEAWSTVDDKVDPETGEIIEAATAALAETVEYYNELDLRFNGVKVPKLALGDKLELVGSKHPTNGYADFVRNQLYAVAAGLGVDPIALTQDYSKANYASNKMSFAHNGRAAETRRARLIRMVAMPMVAAWLEEAIAKRWIDMPKGYGPEQFYQVRDALIQGTFITASRALIEPLKERQGQQLGRTIGVETLESMCAEEGENYEENLEQIARENDLAAELGITLPGMMPPMMPGAVAEEPASDEPNDDENSEDKEPD